MSNQDMKLNIYILLKSDPRLYNYFTENCRYVSRESSACIDTVILNTIYDIMPDIIYIVIPHSYSHVHVTPARDRAKIEWQIRIHSALLEGGV